MLFRTWSYRLLKECVTKVSSDPPVSIIWVQPEEESLSMRSATPAATYHSSNERTRFWLNFRWNSDTYVERDTWPFVAAKESDGIKRVRIAITPWYNMFRNNLKKYIKREDEKEKEEEKN